MNRECVILNGKIINIGAWDNREGTNPLPEGATVEQRDIVESPDGGLVENGAYVDVNAALETAIKNATTLEELKTALAGNIAKVRGRKP